MYHYYLHVPNITYINQMLLTCAKYYLHVLLLLGISLNVYELKSSSKGLVGILGFE